jgi:hypothetical protein
LPAAQRAQATERETVSVAMPFEMEVIVATGESMRLHCNLYIEFRNPEGPVN